MILRYLFDENTDTVVPAVLRQRDPDIVIWRVGDPGAPPLGTLDPEILVWCERHDLVLVTNNRHSMPIHLAAHLAADRHVPGIFVINLGLSIGQIVDILILAAYASHADEHRDLVKHLLSL
jgi:hypothetical protein